MTQQEMAQLMDTMFNEEINELRKEGQKEYARDNKNAFANFERISSYLDMDRKKVCMTYLLKHIDGIASWVDGHQDQREPVQERINDAIVYLCLLRGMVSEDVS